MPEALFYDIISGKRQTWGARLARTALSAAEIPYRWGVQRRNWRFDAGRTKIHRVAAPVISVGNLSLGGTGKTPMVVWLARQLRARGLHVALVSRGYASGDARPNDEAQELAQQLPGIPHVQHADRVAAAQSAIRDHGAEVIVLDDGFQHRRLHRDLDIVLIDALRPFGFGHLFPRGSLREPPENLNRAHAVVLTRADVVATTSRQAILDRLAAWAPNATITAARHAPSELAMLEGTIARVQDLAGKSVVGFCGIGNPEAFRHTLERLGAKLISFAAFDDHFAYSGVHESPVRELIELALRRDADLLVCTGKDLVKLPAPTTPTPVPIAALRISLELESPDALWQRVAAVIP